MRSKLELTLLGKGRYTHVLRASLFDYVFHLDNGATLRRMRTASSIVRDMVDSDPSRMFRNVYVNAPLREDIPDREFDRVATFCEHLTVTVNQRPDSKAGSSAASRSSSRSRPSIRMAKAKAKRLLRRSTWLDWQPTLQPEQPRQATVRRSVPYGQLPLLEQEAQDLATMKWLFLFGKCGQLKVLTLRVEGDSAWPGKTDVESTLVTIRGALEQSNLVSLREVRFTPIHAMGIIHLRWAGLGTFGSALPIPTNMPLSIWQRLGTLDLRLLNPFTSNKLTASQALMFKKLLYDYLRSFTPTLRVLRFAWLEGEGPSPLTLHLDEYLAGPERAPLHWPRLEELWLGNILVPQRTFSAARALAPGLRMLQVLRSTHRDYPIDHTNEAAWVDQVPRNDQLRPPGVTSRASSIYSQGEDLTFDDDGGVSRTSRVVPFFLQLSGRQTSAREAQRRAEQLEQ